MDFLIVALCSAAADAGTIADNKSNSFTELTTQGGGPNIRWFYVKNATCGTNHIFTNTSSSAYCACFAYAFSGSDLTTPLVAQNGANGGAAATSVQTGSVTPGAANDLVFSAVSLGTETSTAAIDNSFNTPDQLTYDGATSYTGAVAWKLQTGAVNPTWSWTGGVSSAPGVIATFTAATGGGGGRTTKNTRAWPLGMEVGMGWRMPCAAVV